MSASTRESKRRKIKEKRKETLNEIRHLVKECGVPIKSVAKRVRLSYSKVRSIIKRDIDDPEVAFIECPQSKSSTRSMRERVCTSNHSLRTLIILSL